MDDSAVSPARGELAPTVAVIGGGPAGLMAADAAVAAGASVMVFDAMPSCGRKFLLAGKGGLNLTHAEAPAAFATRYGDAQARLAPLLAAFDAQAVREFAAGLGIDTFVGSSDRVFPRDMKAAPLLRGWLHRLRGQGVGFRMRHRWHGWSLDGALRFATSEGEVRCRPRSTVLALGGASWPKLGSDGAWTPLLAARQVAITPLKPANCGFDVAWSAHLAERHAGAPVRPVGASCADAQGRIIARLGEFVVTAGGVEGSLIYALSAPLRDAIDAHGAATLTLDLLPDHPPARVAKALAQPRGKRSVAEWLKRTLGLVGVKAALLREAVGGAGFDDVERVAQCIKACPLRLDAARPVSEAISTAGGVRFDMLDDALMLRALPGVFCAGEMLDWEAPTGGYLLTGAFSSGYRAGHAAAVWTADGLPDGATPELLAP